MLYKLCMYILYIHIMIYSNQVPIDGKPSSPKTGAFLQVQTIASIATKCQGSLQRPGQISSNSNCSPCRTKWTSKYSLKWTFPVAVYVHVQARLSKKVTCSMLFFRSTTESLHAASRHCDGMVSRQQDCVLPGVFKKKTQTSWTSCWVYTIYTYIHIPTW